MISIAISTGVLQKKTQERKKKEKPAPEKSGYEMTPEELDAWVQEDMRKQLKPKKASAKGTSGSGSEEILSIHDVPTKASTDVGLRPLDYKIMGEEE